MSDFLNPENATEEGEYGTLEEAIINTKRDRDREIAHTVKLAKWQTMIVNRIYNRIGANKVEVYHRAFTEGLKVIRDEIGEEIEDVVELFLSASEVYEYSVREGINEGPLLVGITDLEVEIDRDWELDDPVKIRVRDSEMSEVRKTFLDNAYLGSWIYRDIIGLGLRKSRNAGESTDKKAQEILEYISRAAEESREGLEGCIEEYVRVNTLFWMDNGIRKEIREHLENCFELMETDSRESVRSLLEKDIETIEMNTDGD